MLFNKKTCSNCGHKHDSALETCPRCHTNNFLAPKKEITRKMSWLPIWQELVFFIVGWIGYQILGFLLSYVFALFMPDDSIQFIATYTFVSYDLLLLGFLFLCYFNHRSILKSFKKFLPYLIGIGLTVLGIILTTIYGTIVNVIVGEIEVNENENIVREITINYPMLSFIFLGFIGPICEELTYRLGLFTLLSRSKKWIAYVLTTLLFAFIHFDFESIGTNNFILEIINIPSYIIMGGLLCFAYDFFGLSCSTTMHISNNVFSLLLTIINKQFGGNV